MDPAGSSQNRALAKNRKPRPNEKLMLTTLLLLSVAPVHAAEDFGSIQIGKPAPDFSLPNLEGETVKLSDHKGKVVVLEWFNPGCPFVKQAHGPDGGLKTMAQSWSDKGVVWLAINSGAPGKQGTGVETNKQAKKDWSMNHPILIDESGKVGRSYAAKTTPQMVVIDPTGNQVYNGALDNAPFGKPKGDALDPITERVLAAVTAGKPSPQGQSKPYGCSVKY